MFVKAINIEMKVCPILAKFLESKGAPLFPEESIGKLDGKKFCQFFSFMTGRCTVIANCYPSDENTCTNNELASFEEIVLREYDV